MPAAPVEDEDTKAAVVTFCLALPALNAALPGGIHDGPLPSPTTRPYGRITCTQGPRPNMMHAPVRAGSGYHDFRKVTVTITGIKAAVVTALGLLRGRLEWQPRDTTDASGNVSKPMTLPNATLIMVSPLPGSPLKEPEKTSAQGDVFCNGIAEYEVLTGRNVT